MTLPENHGSKIDQHSNSTDKRYTWFAKKFAVLPVPPAGGTGNTAYSYLACSA